jgi:hypothetical protein
MDVYRTCGVFFEGGRSQRFKYALNEQQRLEVLFRARNCFAFYACTHHNQTSKSPQHASSDTVLCVCLTASRSPCLRAATQHCTMQLVTDWARYTGPAGTKDTGYIICAGSALLLPAQWGLLFRYLCWHLNPSVLFHTHSIIIQYSIQYSNLKKNGMSQQWKEFIHRLPVKLTLSYQIILVQYHQNCHLTQSSVVSFPSVGPWPGRISSILTAEPLHLHLLCILSSHFSKWMSNGEVI